MPNIACDVGSGVVAVLKFRSPVVVPADVLAIWTPIDSEYGFTVGLYVPLAVPEAATPESGPIDAISGLNVIALLVVPPQARPVALPLPPELVSESESVNACAPPVKSVSAA
jgi:hypothetical protein